MSWACERDLHTYLRLRSDDIHTPLCTLTLVAVESANNLLNRIEYFSWKVFLFKASQKFKTCCLGQNLSNFFLGREVLVQISITLLRLAHELRIAEKASLHTAKLRLQKNSGPEVACSCNPPFMDTWVSCFCCSYRSWF